MKVSSIIVGMFLLPIFSLEAGAESVRPQESSGHATGIPVPTLKLTGAKSQADGSIEFQVDSTEQFKVLIQSSADLANWSFEMLREPHTVVVFTNTSGRGAHRFYRAADYTLRIHGTVRDIQTGLPLEQAKVTISNFGLHPLATVQTDAQGVFQTVVSKEYPVRRITVEKAGYDVLTTEPRILDPANPDFVIPLWLAPPGYRPPNDDFQNRLAIEGTNVVVQASTFAATSEPGHELDIFFDDYFVYYRRNLWWTWTAPRDGAVLIQKATVSVRGESGVVVYTGESLPELVRVWDSYFWDTSTIDNGFFVKQGVQYQIGFGTVWPSEAGFTFRMVAPVPPFEVGTWIGNELHSPITAVGESFSLSVRANGTSPLTYQWRKDGLNIPDATNTWFLKKNLGLEDAGPYSVLVANEAGTAMSQEIQITVLPERPQRPELLRGTWTQETSQGPLMITFADREFTATWVSNNSFAGSGHYRFSETGSPSQYRLVMTYTEPLPEVVRYFRISLTSPDTGSYREVSSDGHHTHLHDSGTFTRPSQP